MSGRSARAIEALERSGFKGKLTNLAGGITAWAAAGQWLTGSEPFTAKLHPEYAPYGDYDQLMRLDEWYGRGDGARVNQVIGRRELFDAVEQFPGVYRFLAKIWRTLTDEAADEVRLHPAVQDAPPTADQVIRLRTFSKGYGLAGARVGYAITNPELAGPREAHTPMKRFADPWEMVGPALFLVSDEASWVSGAAIPVDGATVA
mgnify:CR=1 FL=1